mmetsp:Transcript_64499/g.181449  ORF Transcript_64499/g.181449 Transcript_64499/m.181449 type:complete len:235 (+) Transcript_64499:291-995(+)
MFATGSDTSRTKSSSKTTCSSLMTSEMPSHMSATNLWDLSSRKLRTLGVATSSGFPVTALKSRSPSERETASATGSLPMVPRPCACARRISRTLSSKPLCATRKAPSKLTTAPPAARTRSASDSSDGLWSRVSATVAIPPAEVDLHSTHRESPAQATNIRAPVMRVATTVEPSGDVRYLARNSASSSSSTSLKARQVRSSVQGAPLGPVDSFFNSLRWQVLAANSAQRWPWWPS